MGKNTRVIVSVNCWRLKPNWGESDRPSPCLARPVAVKEWGQAGVALHHRPQELLQVVGWLQAHQILKIYKVKNELGVIKYERRRQRTKASLSHVVRSRPVVLSLPDAAPL